MCRLSLHKYLEMSSKINLESGLTVLETIVVTGIIGILVSMAFPEIGSFNDSMGVTHSTRATMLKIAHIRSEAIRSKDSVRISFNETGFSYDIGDDGSSEDSYILKENTEFSEVPDDIVFDGFGFAREIGDEITLNIGKNNKEQSISINANGHIDLD